MADVRIETLQVKYWLGFLKPETILSPDGSVLWGRRIKNAAAAGFESHVFKIKEDGFDAIKEIETYLQTRYSSQT